MKKTLILLLVFSCSVGAKIVDRVVAVVNDDVITDYELQQSVGLFSTGQKETVAPRKVLDNLVDQKLLEKEIRQAKVEVTNADLSNAIANVLQKNRMTLEQLQQELMKKGASFADFKKQLSKQVEQGKFIQQTIAPLVQVTSQDIESYRRHHRVALNPENKARLTWILFPLAPNLSEKERQEVVLEARDASDQARKGGELQVLAETVKVSFQPEEIFSFAALPDVVVQTVQRMDVSAISDPIIAPQAVYVVKLLERFTPTAAAMDDNAIWQTLYNQRFDQEIAKYMRRLRQKSYVDIRL